MIHCRQIISTFVICAVLLSPLPATAWNSAGHRLSAYIAWQQLDQSTRDDISRMLSHHPDREHWAIRAKGMTPELAAFLEASTWPDDIKGDNRFFDAGKDQSTPLLPGFPDMERHRYWHYIDRPLGHTPKEQDKHGELDRRLDLLITIVGNPKADNLQRAYALPWLIHLVADAHQPLHTVSRYDAAGLSDEGGNLLTINNPFHPRLSSMKLHSYWDDLTGPPWLRGRYLERTAAAITAAYPSQHDGGDPQHWIDESWQIAHDDAYPPGDEAVPTLTPEFHQKAQAIARRRIAEAGYRLAELLQKLLAHQP